MRYFAVISVALVMASVPAWAGTLFPPDDRELCRGPGGGMLVWDGGEADNVRCEPKPITNGGSRVYVTPWQACEMQPGFGYHLQRIPHSLGVVPSSVVITARERSTGRTLVVSQALGYGYSGMTNNTGTYGASYIGFSGIELADDGIDAWLIYNGQLGPLYDEHTRRPKALFCADADLQATIIYPPATQ